LTLIVNDAYGHLNVSIAFVNGGKVGAVEDNVQFVAAVVCKTHDMNSLLASTYFLRSPRENRVYAETVVDCRRHPKVMHCSPFAM
jgi:hypothetical protein